MRQLGLHDRENDDDHRRAGDEIKIERVTLFPKPAREPGDLVRPRREGDEDGQEIKRQREQRRLKRAPAVSLHRAEGTPDHMASEADLQKFPARPEQRGHAPERDQRQHEQSPPNEKKAAPKMTDRPEKLQNRDRA